MLGVQLSGERTMGGKGDLCNALNIKELKTKTKEQKNLELGHCLSPGAALRGRLSGRQESACVCI